MPTRLPRVPSDVFAREMQKLSPVELSVETVDALEIIYRELARWAPRVALIGPGTADEVLTRHFGESLAALPLLPTPGKTTRSVLDLGSGAGFPGLVLAAARPELDVILTEPRQRKWAYLKAVARKAALPCRCLDARVDLPLPPELPDRLDAVTVRALHVPSEVLASLARRQGPGGRFLLWIGEDEPLPPPGWAPRRTVGLPGGQRRRILEWRREQDAPESDDDAAEPVTHDR